MCNSRFGGVNCTETELGSLYFGHGISVFSTEPFQNIGYRTTWTATEWPGDTSRAMAQDFEDGGQNDFLKTDLYYAWAVRGPGLACDMTELTIGDVTLTFDNVVTSGGTTVSQSATAPDACAELEGYEPGCVPAHYYTITTAATYEGNVTVGVSYDENVCYEIGLRLFQCKNGVWEDITDSVDTVSNVVWGVTDSLTTFVLVVPTVDIVLVLDRSGSMGGASIGLAQRQTQDRGPPNGGGPFHPDDGSRTSGTDWGIVQFNQDVVPFDVDGVDALSTLTDANRPTKRDVVASITHGGATSIGDGLREALNQLSGGPGLGKRPASTHSRRV